VMFTHMRWSNPVFEAALFKNAYLMVDLFFVLSGFVLCHNYGARLKAWGDIPPFIMLRFGRLFPLHFFFLMVFLVFEIAKYVGESRFGFIPTESAAFSRNTLSAFGANILLLQPFFQSTNRTFNAPSWSIGVEFYAYFVFAFVTLLFRRKLVFLMVSAVLVAFCGVGLIVFNGPVFSAASGFFCGVLSYEFYLIHGGRIARYCAALELVTFVLLISFLAFKRNFGWDCVVLPIFCVLIVCVAAAPPSASGIVSKFLNLSSLRWLGKVSYSVYMCQLSVLLVMSRIFAVLEHKYLAWDLSKFEIQIITFGFAITAVGMVFLVSQATYRWIEVPYQTWFRNYVAVRFPGRLKL
jgi:peptidoglycan/LPS O-acetylase OafA/YrhL